MSDLPEDEAASSAFPSPLPLFRAEKGGVVSLSEVTGPATNGYQASSTGCLRFQKYSSNMVNNAFRHRVKYYDCSIMVLIYFLLLFHYLCNAYIFVRLFFFCAEVEYLMCIREQ